MRISNNCCYTAHNLFRYYCLFSSKTLNPNIAVPSNSRVPFSSLCKFSSGLSSFASFDSYPIRKIPSFGNSSHGSSSVFCFRSYLLKKCVSDSYNDFVVKSSCWLSPRSKFESCSGYKNQSLCRFSSQKIFSLTQPSQCFGSLTVNYVCSSSGLLHCGNKHRCYTFSSPKGTAISWPIEESEVQSEANVCTDQTKLEKKISFPRKFVLEIVDTIRNNGNDLESRLGMLHSTLSVYSITEIFELLNTRRIFGLRFFEWIWSNKHQLRKNALVCSLIIDNLGRLDDYENMSTWLKKFTAEKVCLTYEAFGFLPLFNPTNSLLKESTTRLVHLLNKVGGSIRNSGVCALVEMFCKLDLFEMARYVIKITESKYSYYCLLVREKCRNGLIEDAYSIIREMGEAECPPNTKVYNYILGSLWKSGRMDDVSALFDKMKETGNHPDAITFEILINYACTLGKMDDVQHLLDRMVSQGLEPRLSTHAFIVKTLFAAEKHEAAYKHVVDSSKVFKTSSNMMYSLVANLYREKGDIVSARNTLVEMMEKSLKPDFSIYVTILKQLRRSGMANLARDLENRHSKFVTTSRA